MRGIGPRGSVLECAGVPALCRSAQKVRQLRRPTLAIGPNRKLTATRSFKLKAAATREIENVTSDFAAEALHLSTRLFQIGRVEDE